MANSRPPIGVLKVAAMPAAPPQATSVIRCHSGSRVSRATVEPKAEAIWMIGPSRPTEPPVPIEIPEASALISVTTGRMMPPL